MVGQSEAIIADHQNLPLAAEVSDTPPRHPGDTEISVSRGLGGWLQTNNVSLAFTSYQTGQLFLVGVLPSGQVSFNQQSFTRAMGLHYRAGRLHVGSLSQIWRLENALEPGELANSAFDMMLVPRNAQTTGDIDIHELAVDREGNTVFVNSKYSCLATTSQTHSFRPIWKPAFISKLAPEDRCHLNGMAMVDGAPKYVTAVSQTDVVSGWRARRSAGGVLIDVDNDQIVADQLSMPHSPRILDGNIYLLDSGRGQLIRIDAQTGQKENLAFCPGFLRGLAFHNNHAIATLSKPRDGTFKGLALENEISRRGGEAWCGVLIIDLRNGDIVQWIKLDGHIGELFDVAILPNVRCPMSIGIGTPEIEHTVTIEGIGTKHFIPPQA